MALVVEYLLIVQKADTFCASADAFTDLLNIDSSIDIEGGKARFGNEFECDYAVTSGEIGAKYQRYFHVRFSTLDCDSQVRIDKFSALLKVVRSIMNKVGGQPETLWDDISFHYSKDAYKLIYRVENLMRKLIANFMLVTVGAEWIDESAPKEVKEAIGKSKRREYLNVLHTVDFIHLASFLLSPYLNTSAEDIYERIKKVETLEEVAALRSFIPQSNWTRYFSALVDCDDSYLKKRWEELYELRCKVAHNAIVNKSDFERVQTLVGELEGKLEDAIDKLPQVSVPKFEVEQVAENAASRISGLMGEFISAWRVLECQILSKAQEYGERRGSLRTAADVLYKNNVIHTSLLRDIVRLNQLKNHVVHSTGVALSPEELRRAVERTQALVQSLEDNGGSSISAEDYGGSSTSAGVYDGLSTSVEDYDGSSTSAGDYDGLSTSEEGDGESGSSGDEHSE